METRWKIGDEAVLDGMIRVFVKAVSVDGSICWVGGNRHDDSYGAPIAISRLSRPPTPEPIPIIDSIATAPAPLLVVALCGRARSGKDTAAGMLAAGHGFRRLALADGIRRAFAAVNEPTWEALKDLDAAGKSARWALQIMGTEARHDVGADDHWIDHVGLTIRYFSHYHPAPVSRWVIPDLRYPREAQRLASMVNRMGGRFEVWKIDRPGVNPIAEAAHSSETSVDEVGPDHMIDNDGNLAKLARQVATFAETFIKEAR